MSRQNSGPAMSLFAEHALLPSGWAAGVRIGIDAGVIVDVACVVRARAEDRRVGIALPGVPHLHSHAFQRGMAGLS